MLLVRLGSAILPTLKLLAFSSHSDEVLGKVLREFAESSRILTSDNVSDWHHAAPPLVLQSTELAQISRAIVVVIHATQNRPLTHGTLRPLQMTALHLYFDFASLLGHHFIRSESVAEASRLVQSSGPRYRALVRCERYPECC